MNHTKEEYLGQVTQCLAYPERSWPDFLVEDCTSFIDSLHVYRLKHLMDNIEGFIEYIDVLTAEHMILLSDESFAAQAQATIQALFTLSCVEFVSANKERMLLNKMTKEEK